MPDYVDDLAVFDEDGLLRRVPNWPVMVKFDKNTGAFRPSSASFTDRDGGRELSVTHERPLLSSGGTYTDALAGNSTWGLVRIDAGFVRKDLNPPQIVALEPTDSDPFHALIVGDKPKSAAKALAKAATTIITPQMENQ